MHSYEKYSGTTSYELNLYMDDGLKLSWNPQELMKKQSMHLLLTREDIFLRPTILKSLFPKLTMGVKELQRNSLFNDQQLAEGEKK